MNRLAGQGYLGEPGETILLTGRIAAQPLTYHSFLRAWCVYYYLGFSTTVSGAYVNY